jgi:hypothetical protein
MLGNAMRKYVMLEKKNGYSSQTQSVYNIRIRNYAVRALRDLALLAEKLPEKQQATIFNEEALSPLVRQVLRFRTSREIDKKEAEERRARILGLCCEILDEIGFGENALDLAPDIMNLLMMGGQSETLPTITALKAIYLKGFTKRQTRPA